jgi:voltage-gated potassium channel Kch
LDERFLTVIRTESGFKGVEMDADGPRLVSVETSAPSGAERILATLASFLRPFEHSARVLTIGLLGFLAIVVLDTVAMSLVVHQSLIDAFYYASKIIVTVGPNPAIDKGPEWFKVFSAGTMLGAVGFTAMFTAGIVERLLGRRLTTIIGRRMVPRKDHVVVVGLGQVGTRLCLLLRDLGIPVVTVDRDPDNYNVARAKDYGLPVAIGQGGSRFLLKRLALERARALAAVTDNALENIAVVVTALALQEDLRTLLRAGRGDVSNETRSLFQIGVVRDPYRIGGTLLAAAALGSDARDAFLHEQTVYLVTPEGELEPFEGDLEASRSDQGSSAEERASRAGADGA